MIFINIYRLLQQVKTIAELIDYLVNDINKNINLNKDNINTDNINNNINYLNSLTGATYSVIS